MFKFRFAVIMFLNSNIPSCGEYSQAIISIGNWLFQILHYDIGIKYFEVLISVMILVKVFPFMLSPSKPKSYRINR